MWILFILAQLGITLAASSQAPHSYPHLHMSPPSLHQGLPLISFTTLQWEVVKLKPEQDCIERRPWGSGGGGAGPLAMLCGLGKLFNCCEGWDTCPLCSLHWQHVTHTNTTRGVDIETI